VSLSSENMMKLMAYADGELEGADLEEAQQLLATDPDSVRFVEQLAGLGELVTQGYDEGSGKIVAKFDVADSVMALTKSASKTESKSTPASVSSLAAARAKRGAPADPRFKIGAGIAAALALAASLFLFAQHRADEAPMASTNTPAVPSSPTVDPAAGSPSVATVSSGGTGVSVSTVNSPGNAVSVFYLPTANELSTSVVVWVDETGEK
jgi:anti-sigma factor RsiW